ncbi:AAA family ATPase [Bacillus cereus group sp. Bc253]|uniref:AAA family ATPase n=1 Tax=Bacillus cereus group sp. Bc253 TaxID=3018103 RepID=UPI0022E1B040|nr:AAA family ATPase [Bacillus cereus group sp. Bc253]MDA2157942.1 AAA family ATPase [Bacillus cereus group sp. Bc253]
MKKFTLIKLIVSNHEKIIFDVQFANNNLRTRESLLSTVIIGENGTGKSYLLTVISEVFRAIDLKRKNKDKDINLRYEIYKLEYYIDDNHYSIEVKNNKFVIINKNNKSIDIQHLSLPKRILAVSFMVNDKFTFASHKEIPHADEVYKYLGIRRTSNAAWTTSIVKRVSDSLVANSSNKTFHLKVKDILGFLNFKPKISLVFEPTRKTLFTKKITLKTLNDKVNKYKNSNDYRTDAIKKFSKEDIKQLQNYINSEAITRNHTDINNRTGLEFTLELDKNKNNNFILKDYKTLLKLIDLKLLNSPVLKFYKDDEFEFEQASSGEKHLIFTLINIASEIEEGSLVLIDEPELSLHPNWQLNYINNLKKIFQEYSSNHFILATHSHYLVSDLEKSSSSIVHISLEKTKSELNRKARLIEMDTYAWSAENVLYNIFEVRTVRNYYFEMDLRRLISLIKDKSTDTKQIQDLIQKLKRYTLDENDPINIIIYDAERYLDNVADTRK